MAVIINTPTDGKLQVGGAVICCTISGGIITPIAPIPSGGVLLIENNLSDVANAVTAATNLGLGPASNAIFGGLITSGSQLLLDLTAAGRNPSAVISFDNSNSSYFQGIVDTQSLSIQGITQITPSQINHAGLTQALSQGGFLYDSENNEFSDGTKIGDLNNAGITITFGSGLQLNGQTLIDMSGNYKDILQSSFYKSNQGFFDSQLNAAIYTINSGFGDPFLDAPIYLNNVGFNDPSTNVLFYTNGVGWTGPVIDDAHGGAGDVSGILKADGSGNVSAAAAGTDYLAPAGNGSALTGITASQVSGVSLLPIVTPSSPTTGQTVSAGTAKLDETLYITPAGTLLALTISLPAVANCRVGQIVRGFISQIITTLTVNEAGSGTVVGSTPVTSAVNSFFAYQCFSTSGNGTWGRIS